MSGLTAEPGPQLVPVFCTNAIRTSAGCGPGVRWVPPDEAARIVAAKLGVYGETAPAGYSDGGNPAAIVEASRVYAGGGPASPGKSAVSN